MAVRTATGGDAQANIGEDGAFVKIREVTKWNWRAEHSEKEVVHSGTNGLSIVLLGAGKGAGTMEGVFDDAYPITGQFTEGDEITLKLFVMPAVYLQVRVAICSLEIDEPIMAGDLVTWSASFRAVAAWTWYPVDELDLLTPI